MGQDILNLQNIGRPGAYAEIRLEVGKFKDRKMRKIFNNNKKYHIFANIFIPLLNIPRGGNCNAPSP